MQQKTWFQEEDTPGHYTAILSDMAGNDVQGFCNYTHMNPELFIEMAKNLQGRMWYLSLLESTQKLGVVFELSGEERLNQESVF